MGRRSIASLLVALAITSSSYGAAPRRPGGVPVPTGEVTAVLAAKSFAAWRIRVPTEATLQATIVTAGTPYAAIFWVHGAGGGGTGGLSVQLGARGVGVHESFGALASSGGTGVPVPAGDYWAIAIVGGGTVHAGLAVAHLDVPEGTTVLGFTSGPAIDMSDAHFTSEKGVFAGTPVASGGGAHGTVRKTFQRGLFGYFVGFSPAVASYTGPDGVSHSEGSFSWFNAEPGTYTFRVDEHVPPEVTRHGRGPNVIGLMADIDLP